MHRHRTRIMGALCVGLLGLLTMPRTANAVDCEWFGQDLVPRDGKVPASLSAILWTAGPSAEQKADPSSIITFSQIDSGGASTPVPFRLDSVDLGGVKATSIVPTQSLVAGHRYRIVANPLNGENLDPAKDFDVSEFETTAALALPTVTNLGELRLKSGLKQDRLSVISSSGASEFLAAYQDIDLALSPELAPWGSALVYETLVDGVPWRDPRPACGSRLGSSWMGRGIDRVFAPCGTAEETKFLDYGIDQGEHKLQFRARLVGSTQVFLSSEVSVNFACGPGGSTGTGGGSNTTSAGNGTSTETGSETGGGSGTTSDATGTQTGNATATGSTQTGTGSTGSTGNNKGSTCSVASAGGAGFAWSLGLLALLGLRVSRKR